MAGDLKRIPEYFQRYTAYVTEEDLFLAMDTHQPQSLSFFEHLPADKWDHRYAEAKWTIKEMLQHIIDTERVFQYRALAFSRKDKTDLPSFDENLYASNAEASRRSPDELLKEFELIQKSGKALFQSFSPAQLQSSGFANGKEVYVEGMGFIMVGHVLHHIKMIRERYL